MALTTSYSLLSGVNPRRLVVQDDHEFDVIDQLTVTGARVVIDGRVTILAEEINHNGRQVRVRDEAGRRLWLPRVAS